MYYPEKAAVRTLNLSQACATPPARNGSRDVVDHVTNRFAIRYCLLVIYWNRTSISNRFRDIRLQHLLTTYTHHKHDESQYLLKEVIKLIIGCGMN